MQLSNTLRSFVITDGLIRQLCVRRLSRRPLFCLNLAVCQSFIHIPCSSEVIDASVVIPNCLVSKSTG